MIEIGKSLPNLTDPAATTGAAETLAFKSPILFKARPCRAAAGGSTLFSGLEYQGCAMGDIRRQHEALNMTPRSQPALPMQGFGLHEVCDFEAQRIQRHPHGIHLRQHTELIAKRYRLHDFDIAILGTGPDADRRRMQVAQ